MYKKCIKCGKVKVISDFPIRSDTGKRRNECHDCKLKYLRLYRTEPGYKVRASELNKKYRELHHEKLNEYSKKYQKDHLGKFRKYNKKYQDNMDDEQKEKRREREKRYREKWKGDPDYIERRREWSRQSSKRRRKKITAHEEARKEIDLKFKLTKQFRNNIRMSFKRRSNSKTGKTAQITGLSSYDLYWYLQQTYKNRYGDYWDGKEKVHIDHIVPLAIARTIEQVIALNHYTNLQLLKAQDNLEKGARINVL